MKNRYMSAFLRKSIFIVLGLDEGPLTFTEHLVCVSYDPQGVHSFIVKGMKTIKM